MYAIDFDQQSGTLELRLTGFWTVDTMNGFVREFTARVVTAARLDPKFVILSDCRDYPVQSAEIGTAWANLLGSDTAITAPYAVVVGSMLNKLQAERALTAPNIRVFTGWDAASRWLADRRAGHVAD